VKRARRHLRDLDNEIDGYLGTQPIRVEHRVEPDGDSRHIRWIASAATEPPNVLGLIVGDWANNVRAALDYTVYELVRKETGEEDPRWTQFPSVLDQSKYEAEATRRLRGVPTAALPLIEGAQPFNNEDDASLHALAVLADISNRDKHRILHTSAMQIAGSQARVSGTSMMRIYRLDQNPGSVVGERVILDALIDVEGDDYEIGLDVKPAVALEGYEAPVDGLLTWITDEAVATIEQFAAMLD
jgi:hypothetical protein